MPVIAEVRDYQDELTAIRRDIHAHPELAFAERRTADLVAAKLVEFGYEVHRGLAGGRGGRHDPARQFACGDRAARRYGCVADSRDERFRPPLHRRRQNARLRP